MFPIYLLMKYRVKITGKIFLTKGRTLCDKSLFILVDGAQRYLICVGRTIHSVTSF